MYCVYLCVIGWTQKIIAFENGFESLMDIIQAEDYSEGGVSIMLYCVLRFVHTMLTVKHIAHGKF